MPDYADFLVRSGSETGINVDVERQLNGTPEYTTVINKGEQESIKLADTDVSLVIKAKDGVDLKNCPITLKSMVDLTITYSRTNQSIKLQILHNELPPDVPTTVNVNLGDDPPDPPDEGGN